jgi:coenzyme Q-binding protein COQ10
MLLSPSTSRALIPVLKCSRRALFSFPDFSFPSNLGKTYQEKRVLPYVAFPYMSVGTHLTVKSYSAKELYAVVADVASYPKFVPFCIASRIDASSLERAMQRKTTVAAELTVGFMSFKESYVSTVTCIPYESVQVISFCFNNWS